MLRYAILFSLCLTMLSAAALAQSPVIDRRWQVAQSQTVVVGVAEEMLWVVRPDRRTSNTRPGPNGTVLVELQNPAEYVAGRVVTLRVREVLKGSGRLKPGARLSVFVPGPLPSEGAAAFVEKREHLVFLSPLKAEAYDFDGAVVYRPGQPAGGEPPYRPTTSQTVVGESNGVVLLGPQGRWLVEEVRGIIRGARKPAPRQ